MPRIVWVLVPFALACRKDTPPADPAFSDALIYVLSTFEGEEIDLAYGLRDLEDQIWSDMDPSASNPADRALQPAFLTEADVADLERQNDDRDLAKALPVAVAGLSAFPPADHARIQMLVDQTPVEPYSPDHYVRTFVEGRDCWEDRGCDVMRTTNDLTKDNLLMTVDYVFAKDFRWIDMALPDPSDVTATTAIPAPVGDPRFAILARSWTDRSYAGRTGDSFIHQSFTVEIWIPTDDGGTLRLLSLWSETEFVGLSVSDDTIIATTRSGIDNNYKAAEDWLEENP